MATVANTHSPLADSSPSDASTPASKAAASKRKRPAKGLNTSSGKSGGGQRELLTPSQKQSNHRNAEVRRRQEITERLTTICDEMVPGAKGLAKSTEAAYTKAHEYLRDMLLEKKSLIEQIQAMGGVVPQDELDAVTRLEAYYAIEDGEESEGGSDDSDADGEDGEDENEDGEGGQGEDAVNAAESLNAMKTGRQS